MTGGILLERLPRGLNESPLMPNPCCPCHCHAGNLHPHTPSAFLHPRMQNHICSPPHPSKSTQQCLPPGSVLGGEPHAQPCCMALRIAHRLGPKHRTQHKGSDLLSVASDTPSYPDKGCGASFPPIAMQSPC